MITNLKWYVTIVVNENTNDNVDAQTDEGYAIQERVPDMSKVSDKDIVFKIEGGFSEFQDFWLDGVKMVKDQDYTAEEGSTKITIKSQTLKNAGKGTHTIAGEFKNENKEMKKAAQNYTVKSKTTTGGGGGGGGSSAPSSYKITLDSVEGMVNGQAIATLSIKAGEKIADLPTPTKDGFKFGGWYKDAKFTQPYDANEEVKKSFALYANWIPLYKVTLDAVGGLIDGKNVSEIYGASGEKLDSIPTPVKDGYIFAGWYKDADFTQVYNSNETVTGTFALYAKWDIVPPEKAPEKADGFADVNSWDWFYNDVEWAYSNKHMVGVNTAYFMPSENVTQGMIVTVLARMAKVDTSKYAAESYADVPENEWYTDYAKWAKKEGLLDGVEFNPTAQIPRECMCVVLKRFIDYTNTAYDISGENAVFNDDALIEENAKDSVQALYKLGIIKGRGEGVIDPDSATTRAELAALMHRIADLMNI